jgi:hypothetical protein
VWIGRVSECVIGRVSKCVIGLVESASQRVCDRIHHRIQVQRRATKSSSKCMESGRFLHLIGAYSLLTGTARASAALGSFSEMYPGTFVFSLSVWQAMHKKHTW